MNNPAPRPDAGMTLIELTIAMVIMGMLVGATMVFLNQQGRALAGTTERTVVQQNLRFTTNLVERELRNAGTGVVAGQPFVVYAGDAVFAFNADLVGGSGRAVYDTRGAPEGSTIALTAAQQITIPGTEFRYPSADHRVNTPDEQGGQAPMSPAELIVLFFVPDVEVPGDEDFVLMRQVNALAPEVVARNLRRVVDAGTGAARPFFEYYGFDADGNLRPVPAGDGLKHQIAVHGAPGDTGVVAAIDAIRAVRLNVASVSDPTAPHQMSRETTRLVYLHNAGIEQLETCGAEPVIGASLAVEALAGAQVRLTWPASPDEMGGERDIMMYVLWRREPPGAEWGEPLVNLAPTGDAVYEYVDARAEVGRTYQYMLRAQDCSPALSAMATSATVTVVP